MVEGPESIQQEAGGHILKWFLNCVQGCVVEKQFPSLTLSGSNQVVRFGNIIGVGT